MGQSGARWNMSGAGIGMLPVQMSVVARAQVCNIFVNEGLLLLNYLGLDLIHRPVPGRHAAATRDPDCPRRCSVDELERADKYIHRFRAAHPPARKCLQAVFSIPVTLVYQSMRLLRGDPPATRRAT